MPRYSVVIPTYNRSGLVGEAVASVLDGGFDDVEVIVVDDGSTDSTPEVVAELGRDLRVRSVTVGRMGAGAARNVGIAMSRGEWVAFLDSDDLWEPGYLEAVDAVAEDAPDSTVALHTASRVVDLATGAELYTTVPSEVERPERRLLVENFVPSVIARRTTLDRIGGWDPTFRARQDMDLSLRLAHEGTLLPVPDAWLRVRVGGTDRISADVGNRLEGMTAFYRKHRERMTFMERSRAATQIVVTAVEARDAPAMLRYGPVALRYVASEGVEGIRRHRARSRRARSNR